MKKMIIIICIASTHFVIGFLILVTGTAASINQQAINYVDSKPNLVESILPLVVFFPAWFFKSRFSGDWSLLFWAALDSLLWGFCLYWVGSFYNRMGKLRSA